MSERRLLTSNPTAEWIMSVSNERLMKRLSEGDKDFQEQMAEFGRRFIENPCYDVARGRLVMAMCELGWLEWPDFFDLNSVIDA